MGRPNLVRFGELNRLYCLWWLARCTEHVDDAMGRTHNPMPPRVMKGLAVTIGSDAANPDAAIPVARPGHDLAAKPDDLGGMHLRINPQGGRRRPPHAP